MRERVFVVVADRGEANERRLLVQNLIDDPLHHTLDLPDVGGLADPDRVDDVLGDGNRLGIGTIGGRLGLLVELPVRRGFGRRVDLERLDLRILESALNLLESVGRTHLGLAPQKGQEKRPVAGRPIGTDMNRADASKLAERQDVSESRVVAEIESEPSRVEEDEFSRDSEFELTLLGAQLFRDLRELGQRFLHGGVLERIELDRAQRGIERDHEIPSATTKLRADLLVPIAAAGPGRRSRHSVPPRIARLTAFLTITSFSPAARLRDSCAFLLLILPSAIAAQARVSESSFLPMNPLALSRPSRSGTPASPARSP